MKMMIGAIALALAVPALAQTAPASEHKMDCCEKMKAEGKQCCCKDMDGKDHAEHGKKHDGKAAGEESHQGHDKQSH